MGHPPTPPTDIGAAFEAAVAAHRQGLLLEARDAYRAVVRLDGRHADAWHLLGLVHLQQGEIEQAERLIRQALDVGQRPAYWANLGNILKDTGRAGQAQAAYEAALALQPSLAEVWNNLALAHVAMDQAAQAETAYRRALAAKPGYLVARYNLGVLLAAGGRAAEAEREYREAIAQDARFAAAHHNLGTLLQESGRTAEAEAHYRRALEIRPAFGQAQHSLGVLLYETSRLPEAEAAHRGALVADSAHAEAHCDLGLVRHALGHADEALACYGRALALKPDFTEAHYNVGVVLDERGQWAAAEVAYRRALQLQPGMAAARYNLAIVLLRQSRFAEGWALYQARYDAALKPAVVLVPQLPMPPWRGEPPGGKSFVIWPEQGFGDYIQFARYAALLKARGASRLTLVSHPPLAALLETVDGVDEVVTDPSRLRPHDHWTFPLSLPLHFSTALGSIPLDPLPYVHASPQRVSRWRERLPATRPRVGLVWRGSAGHKNDANRSLPGLASLAPLWSVAGVSFISLQKGQGEEEAAAPPPGQSLVALGAAMDDFADAAAIVSQLDLVICVDTAIAHVAGAMGKPCWVLLPAVKTDWRWGLEGDRSPWYPSLRLFRQTGPGGWEPTIAQVAQALGGWAAQAAATTSPTS